MDNKQIQAQLRRLAKGHKHAGVADLQALAAGLREIETFNAREIKLLVDAAKADVLEDLSTPADSAVRGLVHERLATRILSESDASHEEARWAVDTWAKAFSGGATPVEHAQAKRPALSWDTDDPPAPKLSSLRTIAPSTTATGNALPAAYQAVQAAPSAQPAASWPPPPLSYVETAECEENTSGTHGAALPPQISALKWNWGAFFWGPWWLMFNGMVLWGIVVLIVGLAVHGLTGLVIALCLGASGHGLAWRHRRFESVDHYLSIQRAWARIGFICVPAVILILLAIAIPNFIRARDSALASHQYNTLPTAR